MALSRTRTQKRRVGGRGRRELRQKMETRRAEVKGEVGRAEGQRVDVAAQCQDPENNNRVFLPLLLQVGDFHSFILGKQWTVRVLRL